MGRFQSVDPLADAPLNQSWSPYTYTWNNPISNIDPDGRHTESTHTDANGNVIAVYDDGDLGVYRHANKTTKAQVDASYSANNRSAGGVHMGRSLHTFSFTDFAALEKGKIIPEGYIDFNSNWAGRAANNVMWRMAGKPITHYALNAGQGEDYDIKSTAFKLYGSIYYGSVLHNDAKGKIFASARDAGNFAAGMVQQRSILPNYITSVGFGAFNYSGSKKVGFALSLEKFFLDSNPDPFNFGPSSPLKAPYYGEDIGTGNAIKKGREHYKANPFGFNLKTN